MPSIEIVAIKSYILHHMACIAKTKPTEILSALAHECMHVEQVGITISKNQALQILYLIYLYCINIYNDTLLQF